MADQSDLAWSTCGEDGCIGVQLAPGGNCLAHATTRRRNTALRRFAETGRIDARGVPISNALLDRILATAPRDAEGHPTFTEARFQRATFHGNADFATARAVFQGATWFAGATFQGDAKFDGVAFRNAAYFDTAIFLGTTWFLKATFQGDARFDNATFQHTAYFDRATFWHMAKFEKATFRDDAWFAGVTFQSVAWFGGAIFWGDAGFGGAVGAATFEDTAWFAGAKFRGDAEFGLVTFQGLAFFPGASFRGDANFVGATFQSFAHFAGATFHRDAGFDEVMFEKEGELGPLLVYGVLRLDAAHFAQPIQIEASARGLSCQRTRFPAGVRFRLRGPQIVLDDADLSGPSILAGIDKLSDNRLATLEQRLARAVRRLAPQAAAELSARPRLLSVQGANVAGLALADVDLVACRFAGAHNLDRLRLGTRISFSAAPVRVPWDWRKVIAEECAWRAARPERLARLVRPRRLGRRRWNAPQLPPTWLNGRWPDVLPAGQIAGVYRALRKGREDVKDEPGAADFYYGEMEMRRRAHPRTDTSAGNPTSQVTGGQGQVERAILTVYWLVSGYGLRAWRALAWLAVVTVVFAVVFYLVGFADPPQPVSYWTSLLYAFRATLSLTDAEVKLTAWGKLLQALLRLTGPVLLALALLAIRARTKR
jgi:hypothetical protein